MTDQPLTDHPEGLREAVFDAIERIVENELHGLPTWRLRLTKRLTDDVLVALRSTPTQPDTGLRERIEALPTVGDMGDPDEYLYRADVLRVLAIEPAPTLDALDAARAEYRDCLEVRRLLGYLWNATGKNHLRPVRDLFAEDDPIAADIERLAIFDPETPR